MIFICANQNHKNWNFSIIFLRLPCLVYIFNVISLIDITVTASDDDLLTAQAANLLAGSNADQSLLGEIQWTTTRGTFSSDTFTINVPSEVVREPDV